MDEETVLESLRELLKERQQEQPYIYWPENREKYARDIAVLEHLINERSALPSEYVNPADANRTYPVRREVK